MLEYSMHIRWSDEDEIFIATCPELSDASAFGPSPAKAAKELQRALDLVIATHREKGWPLPEPEKLVASSGQLRVRLPKSLHAALTTQAACEGISLNTLIVSLLSGRLSQRSVVDLVVRELNKVRAPKVVDSLAATGASDQRQAEVIYLWPKTAANDNPTTSIASSGSGVFNSTARQQ